MGKGEIARYEQFLLFPQCFQKACFPGASEGVIVWEWVKLLINSLPYDKILDWSKMKAFADDSLYVDQMMIYVFDSVGKRRKCWLPAFSPFPTMFSKALFFRVVKNCDCVVKS